jgi:hypothetical protein
VPKWFSKNRYVYRDYEFIPPEEIYARRIARLTADHEREDTKSFSTRTTPPYRQQQSSRVSREIDEFLQKLNDAPLRRQKEVIGDFRVAKRSAFLNLLNAERSRTARLSAEGWKKAKAAASDRREFHPQRGDFDEPAFTRFGTEALRKLSPTAYPRMWAKDLPRFLNPNIAIPCIQRRARREVMFAKKLAGRAYRTPHHRNPHSGDPC